MTYRNNAEFFPAELPQYDPDYTPVVARLPTYVPARDDRQPTSITVYPSSVTMPTTTDSQRPGATSNVTGNYLDRARGFSHVTTRLAATTAVLAGVGAVTLAGVPVLSFTLLMWTVSAYFVVWLVAWLVHSLISAEGVAFLHMTNGWSYLRREQRHRHAIERHYNGIGKGRR